MSTLKSGVSMPSRAWVVTARMSNILNFSWYFLCIPAIYMCILAYLPIFFNQLSKFWGANPLVLFWELAFRTTLLFDGNKHQCLTLGLIPHFYRVMILPQRQMTVMCVNALSGWYLISTVERIRDEKKTSWGVNALSGWYLISTK